MNDLDALIGTQVRVRLLRVLCRLRAPVSGRQAARLAGVSHKATRSLDELAQMGILGKREGTAQHLYTFRPEHYLAEPLVALFMAEEAKLNGTVELLRAALADVGDVVTAAVYGSSVRGDFGAGSDLDVLVLLQEGSDPGHALDCLLDAAPGIASRYGWRVSPYILDLNDWYAQLAADDAFATGVLRDAVVFQGDALEAFVANG